MRLLGVFLVFFLTSSAWARQIIKSTLDLNGDGVLETITRAEETGGNNVWVDLTISRRGKMVFEEKGLCSGKEDYAFLDLDLRFPGQEIVVWRRADTVSPEDSPGKFLYEAKIWRYQPEKGKFVFYWQFLTHQPYRPGDFKAMNEQLFQAAPIYRAALEKCRLLVQMVRKNAWVEVDRLLGKDQDSAPITLNEVKQQRRAIAGFNSSADWFIETSIHTPEYLLFLPTYNKKIYTIVVNPAGINKIFPGFGD